MTTKGAIAAAMHDLRATQPGYLEREKGCFWNLGDYSGLEELTDIRPDPDKIRKYLEDRLDDMKRRYEQTPRGKNGHTQRAKINARWFMQGIIVFSPEQLLHTETADIWRLSKKFLRELAEKLQTKIAWSAIHADETTLHVQFGLENLDKNGHAIQRRINTRRNVSERDHVMTPQQIQDLAGEVFGELGFRRGVSREISGARHKGVRDAHREEQKMLEKTLQELKAELEDVKKQLRAHRKSQEERLALEKTERAAHDAKTRHLRELQKRLKAEIASWQKEEEAKIQRLKETYDMEKQRLETKISEVRKKMRGDELIRKLAANEPTADETLRAAQENLVPTKLVSFLQRIGHGGFLLQKSEPGWYAPEKRYWGAPKFLSVADFVRDYGQYKDENALGTDFHIRILGTPPIFCLDLDQDGEHMLEKMQQDGIFPFATVSTSPGHFQVWIALPSKKSILESHEWRQINSWLIRRYGADMGANGAGHAFRLPTFLSWKRPEAFRCGFYSSPKLELEGQQLSLEDVQRKIFLETPPVFRDAGDWGTRIWDEKQEAEEVPAWLSEKWKKRRAELLSSSRCPLKKGMPPQADESAVDFRIALDLLAPLSERGGDVVQKRGEQIRKILETEAFQRKKAKPKDYAERTITAVLNRLGIGIRRSESEQGQEYAFSPRR